jgi:bifunctional UDP-N-acetylglucosamine pyrophosphorylase/glucosamine-1-phosphate N-acetyltransferase
MPQLHVLVLAAGKGTRMKSAKPKVLHAVGGRTLLDWVLAAARALAPSSITIVGGHGLDDLKAACSADPTLGIVVQEPQLGTAHAVRQAEEVLGDRKGTLLVLSGDVPLLTAATLRDLVGVHQRQEAAATVLTTVVERPYGYGRIVRSDDRIERIVEERDASPFERAIREINTGVYAFDLEPLFDALREIASQNDQGEYYLTDLVAVYRGRHLPVETLTVEDPAEVRGINSRSELAEAGTVMRGQKNDALMAAGVTLVDPATTYVDADVSIGQDSVLHPNVYLEGTTKIGARCTIHSGVRLINATLGDDVTVNNYCVVTDSSIADGARIGPFAHLRPGNDVRPRAQVGNFVELKKTVLGEGSKANHLAYLGDATIGSKVNVGAGTITCNYDGVAKHQTVIEDGVFVGSDSQLVAPVRVGQGAYIAAGSSIVEDVPAGALAVARARQTNKEGWAHRKKAQKPKPQSPEP